MMNYACAFSQSESGKYCEWIIIIIIIIKIIVIIIIKQDREDTIYCRVL